jgi:hypothetical protein
MCIKGQLNIPGRNTSYNAISKIIAPAIENHSSFASRPVEETARCERVTTGGLSFEERRDASTATARQLANSQDISTT